MSKDDQPTRGGFVPVGDFPLDLPGDQVPARRRRSWATLGPRQTIAKWRGRP